MRTLGRALQILALVMLPMGFLFGRERGPNAMTLEVGFLVGGVAVFLVGLSLQKNAGG